MFLYQMHAKRRGNGVGSLQPSAPPPPKKKEKNPSLAIDNHYRYRYSYFYYLIQLNDQPVQHREVQEHESKLFKKYFKKFTYWEGG